MRTNKTSMEKLTFSLPLVRYFVLYLNLHQWSVQGILNFIFTDRAIFDNLRGKR